jgi:3-(3-hydroxy-phenyl)propionate hydroxylase
MRDAANLSWKLAAVLRGEVGGAAAERLLDSYGIERKAHVRELTTRLKAVGAVICERDVAKARERDARLLAECGGVVKDTPRQDILPVLVDGLVASTPGAGTLFPQPRLEGGALMDERYGHVWRLVSDGSLPAHAPAAMTLIDLARDPEAEGVVAAWMHRHGVHAAIVRPDHYTYGAARDRAALDALITQWQQR